MTNRITNAERTALISHARQLRRQGLDRDQVVAKLMADGISRQRARHAWAKAMLRDNRPR